MATYTKRLTGNNFRNVWETGTAQDAQTWMVVGNKPDGIGSFFYLKKPDDFPTMGVVSSAKLQLSEMNYSGYSSDTLCTVKASRITSYSQDFAWADKPAHDAAVYGSIALEDDVPDSAQYDDRFDKRYKYAAYDDNGFLRYEYYTSYKGEYFYADGLNYEYVGIVYRTYIKYREIDITDVVQDMIDHGGAGFAIYFDMPGTNDNRKYFKSPYNTVEAYQPLITIELTTAYDPEAPELDAVSSPITEDEYEFTWSNEDANCVYELQLSTDNGTSWGSVITTAQGAAAYTANLRTYFGLTAAQYMNNETVKVRVRAKLVAGSEVYYSAYDTSDAFTVFYDAVPAPAVPVLNAAQTITTDEFEFAWNDASDANLVFDPEDLYYDVCISLDGGTTYGSAITTNQGEAFTTVDLRAYLGLTASQYYYNTNVKIKVRTKTPVYPTEGGEAYVSEYAVSGLYTIAFASAPPTPVYNDVSNVIDAYWNFPQSDLGLPNAEKTLTDIYIVAWGTKFDGTAGGQIRVIVYYNKKGVWKNKTKIVTLNTVRKTHNLRYSCTGRLFRCRIENIDGAFMNIAPKPLFIFDPNED